MRDVRAFPDAARVHIPDASHQEHNAMTPQRIPDPLYPINPIGASIGGLLPEWSAAVTAGDPACDVTGEISALSAAQRGRLATLRERIQRGAVTEFPADRRQEFARWLVRNGRLTG
jgi:hypothetical protein